MEMMQYTTKGERTVARRLVAHMLNHGASVSVYDGEEWTVKRSTDINTVLAALATTGMDTVRWYDRDGNKLGFFTLVYGNAPDGSELIADHADNDPCCRAYEVASR